MERNIQEQVYIYDTKEWSSEYFQINTEWMFSNMGSCVNFILL